MMIGLWLICLSSDILKRSKEEALYTIAHELAHVYLEIPKIASMIEEFSDQDKEADKQIIEWGFESESRQKQFSNKFGNRSSISISNIL
jgi:hypothetical protein